MESFGTKCIRCLLCIFNLIFAISGLAILVIGVVIQTNYKTYLDFVGNAFLSAPVLLIIVGVVTFFIAFLGCCGALRENRCMLLTFSVLLAIIFVCELAAGIAAYVLRKDASSIVEKNMLETLVNYGRDHYEGVTNTWDAVQTQLHCCGITDYSNWKNASALEPTNSVPDSCCIKRQPNCGLGQLINYNNQTMYSEGCLKALKTQIHTNAGILGGIGVGLALIQILGILLACCFAHAVYQEYDAV